MSEETVKIEDQNLKTASFGEAFKFWLKLGFISFGGPAGQIAIMHRELVERKKWISEEKFNHALNFCMLLPGPEAQQLATYNGWLLHGVRGGIVAGAFFVIPSIFILLAISYVYARFGEVAEISAVLDGIKAVVVAIVVEAVWKIGKKAFKTKLAYCDCRACLCRHLFSPHSVSADRSRRGNSRLYCPKFKV